MAYPIRKCKCGVGHECPLMDPQENGRRAQAVLRRMPRITDGKIEARGVSETNGAHNPVSAGSTPVPATDPDSSNGKTSAFGVAHRGSSPRSGAKRGLCEHEADPKTCRVGTCVAARAEQEAVGGKDETRRSGGKLTSGEAGETKH